MTSETPDVVSRLLAKIEQVEQRATSPAKLVEALMTAVISPDEVLRLCQAHRGIVDECALITRAFSRSEQNIAIELAEHTLARLAGGYGIQEDPHD